MVWRGGAWRGRSTSRRSARPLIASERNLPDITRSANKRTAATLSLIAGGARGGTLTPIGAHEAHGPAGYRGPMGAWGRVAARIEMSSCYTSVSDWTAGLQIVTTHLGGARPPGRGAGRDSPPELGGARHNSLAAAAAGAIIESLDSESITWPTRNMAGRAAVSVGAGPWLGWPGLRGRDDLAPPRPKMAASRLRRH